MKKIKILVADDIGETRSVIKKILSLEDNLFEIVGEADNGEEVLRLIPKVKPDVVLMDINMPVLNGLEATERITDEYPSVIVIIMSVQAENEYLKKAMFHGAKEYIIKPFNYDSLTQTIKVTYDKYKDRQIRALGSREEIREGKVIAFFSSKGGVGKSVLALNSGLVYSKEKNKKVLLLDMDLQFGDISMLVNEYNEKTILDAIDEGQLDSYESVMPCLYKYNENLDILFAPGKPEAAEYITKNSVEKLMNLFKKKYDYILIDTGVNFSDITLYVLDYAEKIVFVSNMDIVSLKNTKLGLRVMQSLGYDKNKVKLVINRYKTDYGISRKDVEEVFKDGIFAVIPEEEKTVLVSINKGEPFCSGTKYNKLKIGKAIEKLCKDLVD
ncbi:response regulator [Clostridium sp. SYSU_GA19001]|uniref:response regulator n=1 Tax=Clostridium caldaquaticum TaxID=2940653 RepID=UPI0020771CC3|nr:response regulator [Clostridium caldaquaticum]MCM8710238.1 response regulator [Clostridium caldaquaticum]